MGLSQEQLAEKLNEDEYHLKGSVIDIGEWCNICKDTGFKDTKSIKVYGELPAPDSDKFPWENNVLKWMCCYVCISEK